VTRAARSGADAGVPDCDEHRITVASARRILAGRRARPATKLARYLGTFGGRHFSPAVAVTAPTRITGTVVAALRYLNASVPLAFRPRLLTTTRRQISALLGRIPRTTDLSVVTPAQYRGVLGRTSSTWHLWCLLGTILNGARRSGRWVTTSKLLHAKRPRLLPILDSRVKCHLRLRPSGQWEAIWCAVRDPVVQATLLTLRSNVLGATALSLLRIFDIVVWMQGPC